MTSKHKLKVSCLLGYSGPESKVKVVDIIIEVSYCKFLQKFLWPHSHIGIPTT